MMVSHYCGVMTAGAIRSADPGVASLPRLRALYPKMPILLATGRADQTALNLVATYPYVTLLSKPFTMKELQQHLAATSHLVDAKP